MIPEKYRLKNTIKYPTSVIIGGLNRLGLEIADSLIQQGGYVVIVDTYTKETESALSVFEKTNLISFLDYSAIPHLEDDIKRLDYVFFFQHNSNDLNQKIPTTEFLELSNYLDSALNLSKKFNAKFLLTTSIKAHQMVLRKQDLSLDFGLGITSKKHTIYNEMEFQKYAESLSMEYYEREDLDVKIVRLAEIIGDGIDFTKETDLTEILIDAVTNHSIRLKKDGLNSDWYVHILDASYGIIKAQFSRVTKGEIYSLAYETPFTNLAIAYKVQEFDSEVKEIVFVQEADNLPDLKLYKPAPNLSKIGWSARIDFDEAIKQSLAATKIHVLENNSVTIKKSKGTLVEKIRGFLSMAEKESIGSVETGAITRLIAERKKQEDLKKESVKSATKIKRIKSKRKKTISEKFSDSIWRFFKRLSENFNIFKDKNPFQIISIIVFFIITIFLYANYFAPIIALIRNAIVIYPEVQALNTEISKGNFANTTGYLNTIIYHVEDTDIILSKFEHIFNLVGASKHYSEINKSFDAYKLFLDGLKNLSVGFNSFNNFKNALTNNTILRSSSESYLSVNFKDQNFSNELNLIASQLPFIESGIEKIKNASLNLEFIDLSIFPQFISENALKLNNKIKTTYNLVSNANSIKYLPEILGSNSLTSYLFFVTDNSIPSAMGGSISGIALASFYKGALVDIIVQSVEDINFKYESLDSTDLEYINLRRFGFKTKQDFTLSDLSLVSNMDYLLQISQKIIKENLQKDIVGVGIINLSAIEDFSNLIKSQLNKTPEINSIKLQDIDYFKQIKTLTAGSDSKRLKNSLITQLLSYSINNSIDLFKQNPSAFLSTLFKNIELKNVVLNTSLSYNEFITENNFNQLKNLNSKIPIDVSLSILDPNFWGLDLKPSFTTTLNSKINSDFTVENTLNFRFPEFKNLSIASICIPSNILNGNIRVEGITNANLRYVINSLNNQKCVNVQIINESQINVIFTTPVVANIETDSLRSISYGILKTRGSNLTLDMQINLASSLSLKDFDPIDWQNPAPIVFTTNITRDFAPVIVLQK